MSAAPSWVRETAGALLVDVLVQPRASRPRVGPLQGDRLKIAVAAPPVDGAANAAVVEAIAEALELPRRCVEVVGGATSRRKTLRVEGADRARLEALAR